MVLIVLAVSAGIVYASTSHHASKSNLIPQEVIPTAVQPDPTLTQVSADVPILVYHSVGPKTGKKESKMAKHYHIYPETFEAQMEYLKDNGYTPITFNALVDHYLNGTAIPAKSVVLTFDDGWRDQYTYAYPILQKFGFTASFFIISSYPTGNYPAYMSWADIIALDKAGMEIGSHTVHHLNLTKVSPAQVTSELVDSKATIEKEIGHPITTFVYPEYGQNTAVQQAVKSAGYIAARAGWVRPVDGKQSIFALKSQEAVNNPNPFSSAEINQ